MVLSLIGGALVGAAFLLIALLRAGAERARKPWWARGEAIESMIAVGLVGMIALGFALIVSTAGSGWVAPLLGLGVAVLGSVVGIIIAPRRGASDAGRAKAA